MPPSHEHRAATGRPTAEGAAGVTSTATAGSGTATADATTADATASGTGASGPATGTSGPAGQGPRTVGTELLAQRYRLERLLGQGGMADVYLAVDLGPAPGPDGPGSEGSGAPPGAPMADGSGSLGARTPRGEELVAVKLVRSADPALARRLAQEARALGRLQHPSLVELRDAGVSNGRAFLVMDLVDGPTLAQRLRSGPLTPAATADLARAMAEALAYVHAHGIVHRDVKPGNIMLDAEGRARLTDFGIASVADASALTATGTTLGTASYMAPEQLEHHQVGPPADIWSLAMILLECLLGRRIYEGSAVEVIARRLAGPIPLPEQLPTPWRMLLAGMFDHDPARRPNAADVAAMVQASAFSAPWQPPPPEADLFGATAVMAGHALLGGAAPTASLPPTEALAGAEALAPTQALGLVEGHDLAALRDVDPTLLGPSGDGEPGSRSSGGPRRWWVPWAAAVAAVILIVAVAALLGSSSGSRHVKVAAKRHTTSSSTTTTTTTAPPSAAAAASALLGLVSDDVAAGALSAGQAAKIGRDVSAALVDAATGSTSSAASDLDAAAAEVAKAVSKGTMSASQASQLLGDLSTLASAAGLPAPSTTTTTTTTTTPTTTAPPAPGPPGGPGQGNQGPGKGPGKP